METFRYDAHPMGMFISTVAALSTFYPEASKIGDKENRLLQIKRLIAKAPTIAAFSYRHSLGLPYNYPDNELGYVGNFLQMMFRMTEPKYKPNPVLERAQRERDARDWFVACGSVFGAGGRGSRALWTLAWWRERRSVEDVDADWQQGGHSCVYREGEEGRGAFDGLRASCL
jgi:hypothetical protein